MNKNSSLQKLTIGYHSDMTKSQIAASILGSIKSEKKSLSSKANGRLGGRPKKDKLCKKSGKT